MSGADDEDALYEFERGTRELRIPPSRRSPEQKAQALKILKRRLGITDVPLTADLEQLLLRYCSETILNIVWYDRRRGWEERANARRTSLMVVLMLVALVLLCVLAFAPSELDGRSGAAVLPFAFLAGGALTVLQVIATLADGKARLAIFWSASCDLKEALYNFEHRWHGRVLRGSPPCVVAEFDAAVQDELKFAYAVTRTERLAFFANLRSPSDVFAVAASAVNSLRERRAEVSAALAARDDRIAAARKSVSEARAAVLASEYRLKTLADGPDKAAEQAVLVKAKAEVVRTEAILHDLIGG
jgi:hypothetical protein